jgi:ATPase subunit of ABC transporter with duplicated ATPase domains
VINLGSISVGNATLVVANVLTCNNHSKHISVTVMAFAQPLGQCHVAREFDTPSCGVHAIGKQARTKLHDSNWGAIAPTGAGKTTLLTALAGRASYGILSGKVSINGRRVLLVRVQGRVI